MPSAGERPRPAWATRRQRATHLRGERPHVAALLNSYLGLLDRQEPLYDSSRDGRWPDLRNLDAGPGLTLDRLPFDTLAGPFAEFVAEIAPVMPEILAPASATLAGADASLREELLRAVVARHSLDPFASRLRTETVPLEFFGRAFLQPVAEALAHRQSPFPTAEAEPLCPACGWPAQLALLRDEPATQGARLLVCSLCATEWAFARTLCVNCGERDAERLDYHVADSLPHVRIEACTSCRTYLKIVDLRAEGSPAPLVDEIASVELDLWCDEQGLVKLQRNLFGM
jgi:FdhE protein